MIDYVWHAVVGTAAIALVWFVVRDAVRDVIKRDLGARLSEIESAIRRMNQKQK